MSETPQKKQLVAFDFDGTLADTMPELIELGTRVIAKHFSLRDGAACKLYLRGIGKPFEVQVDEMSTDRRKKDAAVFEFNTMRQLIYATASLHDGVRPAIAKVRVRNVRTAVVSSTPSVLVKRVLHRAYGGFITEEINVVLGIEHGSKRAQLEDLGYLYDVLAFVGDAPHDAEVAASLGIPFVGVETTTARWSGSRHVPTIEEAVEWALHGKRERG